MSWKSWSRHSHLKISPGMSETREAFIQREKIYFAPINPDLSAYRKSWHFAKDSPWWADYSNANPMMMMMMMMMMRRRRRRRRITMISWWGNDPDSHNIEPSDQWLRSPLYKHSKKSDNPVTKHLIILSFCWHQKVWLHGYIHPPFSATPKKNVDWVLRVYLRNWGGLTILFLDGATNSSKSRQTWGVLWWGQGDISCEVWALNSMTCCHSNKTCIQHGEKKVYPTLLGCSIWLIYYVTSSQNPGKHLEGLTFLSYILGVWLGWHVRNKSATSPRELINQSEAMYPGIHGESIWLGMGGGLHPPGCNTSVSHLQVLIRWLPLNCPSFENGAPFMSKNK